MKINVLQFIGSFHTGGSERQAVQLVRLLSRQENCRVFVACLNREGVLRAEIEASGFADIPEFNLTSFYDARFFRQLQRCAGFLRENEIQIVQSTDFYTNVFAMTAGWLAKTPVRIAAKRETGTRTQAQRFLEKQAFRFADAIVANAEAVKKHLIETGVPARKIAVVYNGLDVERLKPEETDRDKILRSFGLPLDKKLQFVTIVANFRSEVKNQRMFLRAAKRVKENFPGAAFVLAGEGELIDEMKRLAKDSGIENDVYFTGRCARVAELLSVSDICVLSSRSEGFSNSILEYMAAGKAVVATGVGGAAEAVVENETGFLVESDDDEMLAARLLELLKDREKAARFGANGRRAVEEKFSLAARTEKTLSLYEKLLSGTKKNQKLTLEKTA